MGKVKLTAIWADQMEHKKKGGDSQNPERIWERSGEGCLQARLEEGV